MTGGCTGDSDDGYVRCLRGVWSQESEIVAIVGDGCGICELSRPIEIDSHSRWNLDRYDSGQDLNVYDLLMCSGRVLGPLERL